MGCCTWPSAARPTAGCGCVLCDAVMPERHQGISQETWVLVSDARTRGAARFHLELRDDVVWGAIVSLGPIDYWRCDISAQSLDEPAVAGVHSPP